MASSDINIILSLTDNATKNLQKFQSNLGTFSSQVRQVGKNLSYVGSSMALLGSSITAPLALAFKTAGDYSAKVHSEINKLGNELVKIQVSIGQMLLPSMQKVTAEVSKWIDAWNMLAPAQQASIVNAAFMAGQWLIVGGVVLTVLGKIFGTIANLGMLITRVIIPAILQIKYAFMALVAGNPIAWLVVVISAIVAAMFKWKVVADGVFGAVSLIVNLFLNGFDSIRLMVLEVVDVLLRFYDIWLRILEKTPLLPKAWKEMMQGMRSEMGKWRADVDSQMSKSFDKIIARSKEMGTIWNTGGASSPLAKGFDTLKIKFGDIVNKVKDGSLSIKDFMAILGNIKPTMDRVSKTWGTFWDGFKMGLDDSVNDLRKWVTLGQNSFKELSTGSQAVFKSMFSDAFHGQLQSATSYFAEFGNKILDIFANVCAKMIQDWIETQVAMGLGKVALGAVSAVATGGLSLGAPVGAGLSIGSSLPEFLHTGGIVRAHNGMLAGDEVPIIAQAGEGVLSKRGMSALGVDNFDRLNKGKGIGGTQVTYNPVLILQAWDTTDVMRNKKAIEAIFINAMKNRSAVRDTVKAYG